MRYRGHLTYHLLLLLPSTIILHNGALIAASGLQCFLKGRCGDMNCTWNSGRELVMDGTYTFHFRSLKYTSAGQVGVVPFLRGRQWVLVPRRNLTCSDQYEVWVEGPDNDSNDTTLGHGMFSMEEIEKPDPPVLGVEISEASSEVIVTWKTNHESEDHLHSRFQLRYRECGTQNWTWVNEEDIEPDSYEFSHLEAFTEYEVQIRHVLRDRKVPKSDWSHPIVFRSPTAAPVGLVDLWWYLDKGCSSLTVLWKELEPKAAKSHNVTYTVSYREGGAHGGSLRSITVLCCNIIIPHSVQYISISAANSVGRTQTASLNLEHSDFPPPEGVKAKGNHVGLQVSWKPYRRLPQEYVVQWNEAVNRSAATIRWKRVEPTNHNVTLTDGFQPQVPYLVSVYGLYPHGYTGPVSVLGYVEEGVPSVGPDIMVRSVSPTKVLVLWDDIPLLQQRGVITHYTIYTRSSGSQVLRSENVSVGRNSSLLHVHPSTSYQLWMSASTSAGEGRKRYIEFTSQDAVLLPVVFVSLTVIFAILCILGLLFHQRIVGVGRWILPEWCCQSIPDPMHSKITIQSQHKDADGSQGAFLQCLYLGVDTADPLLTTVEEISEPAASLTGDVHDSQRGERCSGSLDPPYQAELTPSSAGPWDMSDAPVARPLQSLIISGYEKHFMPSAEFLEQYS
ncbi:interleukin-27 receptor subunit alpha isoform X2 [Microcaecilia unicolor]|uniref:Interleukin-27 receptor subunit alpha isoform X2 n=1 Tax=Microcaecilia unicolor TaxID=1415580 RepID=A0A6P7XQ15_9AMPH|nr:interleukin-27 receptor subunit alpha isoform X2 [Microcaecilia unicolor]